MEVYKYKITTKFSTQTLTFCEPVLTGGLSVQLRCVALREAQQRPHEVRQLLCTQAASALCVKQLRTETEDK